MSTSPAAAYRTAAVERVDAGDAQLTVRRFGAGPPLLLIHGFPLHGFTWRQILPRLARSFSCVVVDLAGLGDSVWSDATTFGFVAHARRLRRVMQQLGTERYAVLAQDTGATIARCLALEDATRVAALIMLNTEIPGHRPPWIREYQLAMRLPGAAAIFRLLLRSRAFLRSGMGFGGCFADLDRIDAEFCTAFVEPYVASAQRTEGLRRYLVGIEWDIVDGFAERHAAIACPSLLVWGADDPTFPLPLAQAMVPQLRHCRGVVAVPDCKLLLHEERPDAVCDAATPFLQEALASA